MKNEEMVIKIGDYLAQYLTQNIPVTASFEPFKVRFSVPGTKNSGYMRISYHSGDTARLQLGVFRNGTDRLFSNFFPALPADEMIRYVRNPETHQVWLKQISHLSDRADDFWD